ncbi:MAG: Sua5/YciO/YrdC/YwlC family protein, partial [Rubripirellula sp.]
MSPTIPLVRPPDDESLSAACDALGRGELVAMPTETVYGLAANAWDENAVAKIFAAKG